MLVRFASASIVSIYVITLYFLSFLSPVLFLSHFRNMHVVILLLIAIVGFGVAGWTFLLLLIVTKRVLIGHLEHNGRTSIQTLHGQRWFSAATLASVLTQSPFWPMASGLSPFAAWYYRGMGAKIPGSVLLGARSRMSDPWSVEIGEKVTIGAEAVILGHLGHGDDVIILGRVVIGEGAIVGMRAVIFPDVRIGKYAKVGAGAVVVRGTVIPDGEVWAGVPARKISPLQMATHA